ncbi:MAG: Swarming motility protein ybiA [Cyanobacteria bacterium RYN_339]|nr:Swarming motility protein ybiA [Cyanobacteria bacterium RYN_339]
MPIKFYQVKEVPYGCFSNFSPHGFELDGKWWATSEHYFQAQKFPGTPHEEELRLAKTGIAVAQMGRERHRPLRPDWESVKDAVMLRALLAKFGAHKDIQAILLATGDEELIEDAPTDYYWGCGKDGSGKNMLGQLLVQVRTALRG